MQSGNNEEYIDLVFERIDDASILSNFYCGIPDMDVFIHEKLQGYLNRTGCEAYVIKQEDEKTLCGCIKSCIQFIVRTTLNNIYNSLKLGLSANRLQNMGFQRIFRNCKIAVLGA